MKQGLVDHHAAGGKPVPPDRLTHYKVTHPGQLVMNRMRAASGLFAATPKIGLVSPDYAVFEPRKPVSLGFFEYLFRSPLMLAQFRSESRGLGTGQSGFLRLYTDRFGMLRAPVPPPGEQAAIVRFLDHADRRIRTAIRTRRRLVALHKEQYDRSVVSAVTTGLRQATERRIINQDWLDAVPSHWLVVPLKHRYHQSLGKMLDSKTISGRNSTRYLRNSDVQWDSINDSDLPVMDIPPSEYSRYTVQPGDLLVCEGGEVGRCAIWKGEADHVGYQKALHRLRAIDKDRDIPRFLYYTMRAASLLGVFKDGHTSTIPHLTAEKLRAHRFPFPPFAEQRAIVSHLDRITLFKSKAHDSARHEIELLQEYRTRLIADVVTGQLDVRAAAAALPPVGDETEDDETLDDAGDFDDDGGDAEGDGLDGVDDMAAEDEA